VAPNLIWTVKVMILPSLLLLVSAKSPDNYCVKFTLSNQKSMLITVDRNLAPIGSDHFYRLVQDRFYDNSAIFRVVPNFVIQFGLSGTPAVNAKWNTTTLKDDPVLTSNKIASLSYATSGPNTRTTQLFINLADNSRLDALGFAPFGRVISDMSVPNSVFNPTPNDKGGIDQDEYQSKGNEWLLSKYPQTTFIRSAKISSCIIGTRRA
jgi:peptidyl-prolyl cis-trans isomerase A (cyclophilin A)